MSRILLEGRPGIGKTTVALRLVAELRARGVDVAGFTTRELRERGRRVGFEIEDLAGERAVLAHVDLPGRRGSVGTGSMSPLSSGSPSPPCAGRPTSW